MFSGLSLLNLLGLTLSLAVPLLVLAYLKRPPENRRTISSLFLLKNLPSAPKLKKKVKLPLRFFLELLALLLFVTAISQPIFKNKGELLAILLDDSMSMAAIDNASGSSRLALAISELEATTSFSEASRFQLFKTSDISSKASESILSSSSVITQLKETKAKPWGDSIQLAISQLLDVHDFASTIVLTDKKLNTEELNDRVQVISINKPLPNYSISAISLSEKNGWPLIEGTAILSGEQPADLSLSLIGLNSHEQETRLFSKELTLRPNQANNFSLPLEENFNDFESFSLELKGQGENSLLVDDRAWLSKSGAQTKKLLLVSPDISGDGLLGLKNFPSMKVEGISPDELPNKDLSGYSLLVFHKSTPEVIPKINSLFILPPKDNNLFPTEDETNELAISSFDETHPVNSYLKPWLLDGNKGVLFDPPAWTQPIINDQNGSLVVAGESGGHRFLAAGIELLPFEGRRTPVSSVLFLNILSWLKDDVGFSKSLLTGAKLDPKALQASSVRAADGEIYSSSFQTITPGIHWLDDDQPLVVNSFYPEESDTFSTKSFSLPELESGKDFENEEASPIWNWLLIASILIMTIDFILRLQSKREQ